MSDSEGAAAAPHPTHGGKTLQSIERPRYKSYRKKYRKMRYVFDGVLEESKRLFKEEHKLESTAKRLREELDGLRELCLDLNENPAIPPELRFNITYPRQQQQGPLSLIPEDVTPENADAILARYHEGVSTGHIPHLDLDIIRRQIDERLAAQNVETLQTLESNIPHPVSSELPEYLKADEAPTFLTVEQELDYINRIDAGLRDGFTFDPNRSLPIEEEKHWAELTPRELERQMELLNPQSQHNWLKSHAKPNPTNMGPEGVDDNESLASHDNNRPNASKKKTDKSKTLAKQVGDRAVERATNQVWSPSAASGLEEDELGLEEGLGSGKKRGKDPDGTYRLKGGKSGGGGKAKRKRSGEDVGGEGGEVKKAKLEEE